MWIVFGDNLGDSRVGANRVFAFIMGICEINAYLVMKAFDHWDESFLSFRKKLAKSLIDNPFYVRELRETRRSRG